MTLHNILDALVRLSITSIPGMQSLVPSAIVRARRQWHNVIFSDKSRFSVSHADGRVRVYRRRNILSAASGNGIDSGAGVLWYGEVSWPTSRQIL